MFRGISNINLDAKGRIAVPTKYRAVLDDCCERQMVVTVAVNEKGDGLGLSGCLWLYPLPEWERLEHTLSKLPTLNPMAGQLRRFVIGYANECELDNQGRLLLPEKLRTFAGMEKHAVLVGLLNKFEIWNEEAWQAKEAEWMNGDNSQGLEELGPLSF